MDYCAGPSKKTFALPSRVCYNKASNLWLKLLLYVSQRENSITEKECNVMEYKFSNRALSAKPSRIREISARGAIDPEFISFAIGNPA